MCGNGDLLVLTGNTFKENSRVVNQIQCHVKNNNQAEHVYFILFINGFMNVNMIEQSIEMKNMPESFLGTESDIVISILDDDSFTHASTDLYFETYMENICNKIGCGLAILGFYAKISNKILSKKNMQKLLKNNLIRGITNFSTNNMAKDYTIMILGENILERGRVLILNLQQTIKPNLVVNNDDIDLSILNSTINNNSYVNYDDIISHQYKLNINQTQALSRTQHLLPQLDSVTLNQKKNLIENIKTEIDSTTSEIDNLKKKLLKFKERDKS